MTSYVLLTLGGLLFGGMVFRNRQHEREPWWMLLLAVAGGAAAMAVVFVLEDQLIGRGGLTAGHNLLYALMAGVLEEPPKVLVPAGVFLLARKYFNDPMDGLLYGACAGLGAAMYEAVWFHFMGRPMGDDNPMLRYGPDAVRLLLHAVWGGIGGYALGLIIADKPWRTSLAQWLGFAVALHIAWDMVVSPGQEQPSLLRAVSGVILGISVVGFGALVVRTNKWSRQMHPPISKQQLAGRILRALISRRPRR